jgi:hypothetical protein
VEDELLEGLPALRDDEEAHGVATGDEGLLDGTAAGDELLALLEELRGGLGRPRDGRVRRRPGGDGPWGTLDARALERRTWALERRARALERRTRAIGRSSRAFERRTGALE